MKLFSIVWRRLSNAAHSPGACVCLMVWKLKDNDARCWARSPVRGDQPTSTDSHEPWAWLFTTSAVTVCNYKECHLKLPVAEAVDNICRNFIHISLKWKITPEKEFSFTEKGKVRAVLWYLMSEGISSACIQRPLDPSCPSAPHGYFTIMGIF